MRRCGQMFRSGICQERDWGPSWAQVGQSEGKHMLLSAQLWAQVWAHEDTHTRHPAVHTTAMQGLCKHAHTWSCMDTGYTHEHTHSLPHPVRILYSQGPSVDNTPSSWAPPFPSLSLPPCPVLTPPPSHRAHPSRSTQGGAPACGEGEETKVAPFPPRLASLPTPALGPLLPPLLRIPPKTRRLPPTHP